jgi:signal transduction histidine kinase
VSRPLRDLPIRRKLAAILMLATGGALVLATAALVVIELVRSRHEMQRDLASLAEVVAQNTTAALTFDDRATAAETLKALSARQALVAAALYDARGALFARFLRGRSGRIPAGLAGVAPGLVGGTLVVVRPIELEGRRIGTVYLQNDLAILYGRVRFQAFTVAGVLLTSAVAALLLTSRLQELIARPIVELAATAREVSSREDYTLRAHKQSEDETGQLVDAFNRMLAHIEERDLALQAAKEELEARVAERTCELEQELAERRRAERRLAEANAELSTSNQELDDFAYIASHDLKEPLRGIHNYASFLIEDYADRLDDDGRAKLHTLTRLSRRMEELIDSLLHFSRVGRTELALEEIDLGEVVTAVAESLAVQLRERGAEVRIPLPLPTVRCDRVRVGEIFSNLISNAVKYNAGDHPLVEVGALASDPAAGDDTGHGARGECSGPVLYVRDNGIGIPDKHREAVFRIFKRLHGRDQFGGGAGAGLTIVKKIVERHHGRIWLESRLGAGTTFFFTLAKGA